MAVQTKVVLEPAAQEIADAFSTPPLLYELDYPAARKVLDDAQAAPVAQQVSRLNGSPHGASSKRRARVRSARLR